MLSFTATCIQPSKNYREELSSSHSWLLCRWRDIDIGSCNDEKRMFILMERICSWLMRKNGNLILWVFWWSFDGCFDGIRDFISQFWKNCLLNFLRNWINFASFSKVKSISSELLWKGFAILNKWVNKNIFLPFKWINKYDKVVLWCIMILRFFSDY
jgi:hypothetical protein